MAIRYAIAIMILLAKCSIYMLRAQMSFAILTMVPRNRVLIQTDNECVQNATSLKMSENYRNRHSPIHNWSELSMCGVVAAHYAGFYSTELFGSYVATFSPKSVISWFILLPSTANTLIPLFLRLGEWTIFLMKVFIGICIGLNQESFAILTLKWAPPNDRILFSGSLYGGILGTICGWIGTAYLGEELGWDIPFYAIGAVGIILTPFWCLLVTDSPAKNYFVSAQERIYLEETIPVGTYLELRNIVSIPWWRILKNKPIWVLCIFMYGDLWNFYFWLLFGPKYLVEVSGFTIKEASLYILVPYLTRLFFSGLITYMWKIFVKYNQHLSVENFTTVRRIFTIFSHIIPGILSLCLGGLNLHCNYWYAYITITVMMTFNGASSESSAAIPQDLSPVYGSNIISLISTFGTTSAVISALTLGGLLHANYAIRSWRIMFFVNAAMYLGPGLLFILFGNSRLQYFHQGLSHVPDISSENFGENMQPMAETNGTVNS